MGEVICRRDARGDVRKRYVHFFHCGLLEGLTGHVCLVILSRNTLKKKIRAYAGAPKNGPATKAYREIDLNTQSPLC